MSTEASLLLLLFIPLVLSGIPLLNAGLARSRSSAHLLLASLCAASTAMFVFVVIGFSFAGFGSAGHIAHFTGKDWNLLGSGRLFARSVAFDEPLGALVLLLQLFSAALAGIIPVGAAAERWRLPAVAASTAVSAAIIYPIFVHWVSAEGWLGQVGFVDAGGAAAIHVLGGLNALSVAWILGPRQGKFTPENIPTATPGHNATLVLFGAFLALAGWPALNMAATSFNDPRFLVWAAVNTVLAGSAGAIGALVTTRLRFGKSDASLSANGLIAGLVAISASAPYVKPAAAMFIGLVVGPLVVFAIELIEIRLHVDDPAGAISVHAFGGLWGLIATSIFADTGARGSFLAQILGIATLLGFVLPASYGLNLLLNRFIPFRAPASGERQGMDLFELGAGAYPEFVTHREDYLRR